MVASAWTIRERERALQGPFLADRIVRESQILRNAIAALDSARLAPGTRVIFVNSVPRPVPGALGDPSQVVVSYMPFEAALRGGDAVRVFLPNLRFLGLGPRIPPDWEDAETFLFSREGELRRLGRGSGALAGLGSFTLQTGQWAAADSMFRRSRALGDTLPDATFGLIYTSHHLGNFEESRAFEREFLRRWPDDPRAIELRGFRDTTRARGG